MDQATSRYCQRLPTDSGGGCRLYLPYFSDHPTLLTTCAHSTVGIITTSRAATHASIHTSNSWAAGTTATMRSERVS